MSTIYICLLLTSNDIISLMEDNGLDKYNLLDLDMKDLLALCLPLS